ncbi:hypothetical protein VB735_24270 [Halotia wernerae UHCC 0503]|nr:hypothetical protein [Halotia wernerae UHCC 0503]
MTAVAPLEEQRLARVPKACFGGNPRRSRTRSKQSRSRLVELPCRWRKALLQKETLRERAWLRLPRSVSQTNLLKRRLAPREKIALTASPLPQAAERLSRTSHKEIEFPVAFNKQLTTNNWQLTIDY